MMSEEHGGELGRAVRKDWLDNLPPEKADDVIRPAFDHEHRTDAEKKEAVKRFKERSEG